jgi:hypothetical protein
MTTKRTGLFLAGLVALSISFGGPPLVRGPLLPLFLPSTPKLFHGPGFRDGQKQEVLTFVARWRRDHPEDRPGWCRLHNRPLEPMCKTTVFHSLAHYPRLGLGVAQLTTFPHSALATHVDSCVHDFVPDETVMGCPLCTDAERGWDAYMRAGGEPTGPSDEFLGWLSAEYLRP